jgi:para-nitrobenzyl esterase
MKAQSCAWLFLAVVASGVWFTRAAAAPSGGTDPIVAITSGQIRGTVLTSGRAEFLGIPFAQPPVGERRWQAPVPPTPWSGVRDAKRFGAPCAQNVAGDWNQHDAESSSEDCLYLNVMTPQWPLKKPFPVMFWIHGGANTAGTASSELYKDGTLVEHGIVLVTANYRLGVFGFFSHSELTRQSAHHSSGNYALLDQIAALEWIRDNIREFGGDPNNVTVFGQSAGALDTGLLMTSPPARSLFQKAIEESGTVLLAQPQPLSTAEQGGIKFAERLGAPASDPIKYLRSLSTSDLLKAALVSEQNHAPGANDAPDYHSWPNIDGWVFPRSPAAVFAEGQESAIPMITGNNTREFDIPNPPDQLRQWITAVYGDLAPKAFEVYGLANGGGGNADPFYGSAAGQWSADFMFRCPATRVAAWRSATHHPTYEYQFERAIPGQEAQGAVHSADLPYVFGFFPKSGNISGAFGETDYKLADSIEKYWTNFARTGNPNGSGLTHWLRYDGSEGYVSFAEDGQVVSHSRLRQVQCEIYRESVDRHLKH